jgi:phosphate/sulfate permease
MLERKEDIINAQISAVSQSVPGGLKDAMISPLLEIKLNPLIKELHALESGIAGVKSLRDLDSARRAELRLRALSCEDALGDLLGTGRLPLDEGEELDMRRCRDDIMGLVEYSAKWVMLGVAVSLGLGTMVGWRRIVVTIGERIGKSKLNYAQGLSAQFTAAFTILLGVFFGLPVSTTHVLSSGVAGSMLAGGSSLHGRILRSIALAWILTLPVAMLLGGLMYLFLRLFL